MDMSIDMDDRGSLREDRSTSTTPFVPCWRCCGVQCSAVIFVFLHKFFAKKIVLSVLTYCYLLKKKWAMSHSFSSCQNSAKPQKFDRWKIFDRWRVMYLISSISILQSSMNILMTISTTMLNEEYILTFKVWLWEDFWPLRIYVVNVFNIHISLEHEYFEDNDNNKAKYRKYIKYTDSCWAFIFLRQWWEQMTIIYYAACYKAKN